MWWKKLLHVIIVGVKDEVIKSFDTYEEADAYCDKLVAEGRAKG